MADGRGGRVMPDNKARPVSGPGKYAQRTDLSQPPAGQGAYVPGGLPYGTRKRLEEAQQVAPAPATRPGTVSPPGAPPYIPSLTEILARPTDRPGEPPTAGLSVGPGPGPEALGLSAMGGNMTPGQLDIEAMRARLPTLEAIANLPDSNAVFRSTVRQLRGLIRST